MIYRGRETYLLINVEQEKDKKQKGTGLKFRPKN